MCRAAGRSWATDFIAGSGSFVRTHSERPPPFAGNTRRAGGRGMVRETCAPRPSPRATRSVHLHRARAKPLFTENTLEPIIPLPTGVNARRSGRSPAAGDRPRIRAHDRVPGPSAHAPPGVRRDCRAGDRGRIRSCRLPGGVRWLAGLRDGLARIVERATGTQILLVWLPTAPIVAFGFRHSVAGAAEAF